MKTVLTLAAAFCALVPAFARAGCVDARDLPKPAAERPVVVGEFHYSVGLGLACAVDRNTGAAMERHDQPVNFLPCLKIGAVAVGDRRAKVEGVLGEPAKVVDLDDHTQSRAYVVPQKGLPLPHYVVTYLDEVAVAVQLMGPPMVMPAHFAGLALGDETQKVIDHLGPPAKRCRIDARGPETWVWGAFPIGIDMLDGHASGFKISWPTKQKPS